MSSLDVLVDMTKVMIDEEAGRHNSQMRYLEQYKSKGIEVAPLVLAEFQFIEGLYHALLMMKATADAIRQIEEKREGGEVDVI